jgi:small conductance mechanosensitive channel
MKQQTEDRQHQILEEGVMDKFIELLNVEEIVTSTVAFLPRLGMAVFIFIAFWILFRITRGSLRMVLERSGLDGVLVSLLVDKIYRIALILFGLVMAASQVGINVAAALAGLGVAGIAIGFAAQDILSNIIAGFVIFLDRPFRVGDFIKVEGQYGSVTNITLRSTRIRTRQNTYVVVPNKNIIDAVVINHSKHGETRVDVAVGIAYKESILDARKVLLEAVSGMEDITDDPPPTVVVDELGDSSVNLVVRVWIKDAAKERTVFFKVTEASKLALDQAGIQIPFPHLQLFWDDVEDGVVKKLATVPKLVAGDEGRSG